MRKLGTTLTAPRDSKADAYDGGQLSMHAINVKMSKPPAEARNEPSATMLSSDTRY